MKEIRTSEWCVYAAFGLIVVAFNALDCPFNSWVSECCTLDS